MGMPIVLKDIIVLPNSWGLQRKYSMFKKIIVLLVTILLPFHIFAEGTIVHGPFKVFPESYIYIKKENNINYPLSLYLDKKGEITKIDSYETNGADPNIETIFFINLNGVKNMVILVSWYIIHRAEKINGTLYQVYGYEFFNGKFMPNKKNHK